MMKFGLIGYPISHSLSPSLFAAAYGDKYPYDLIETPDFEQAWQRFTAEYQAVNVTMPFKAEAARRADIKAPEVLRTGVANILVKTPKGIEAHNSDYLGVREILSGIAAGREDLTVAVIGTGGAGRAAGAAAEDLGMRVSLYHHDQIADGVCADIVIYALPCAADGAQKIRCRWLLEANYLQPALAQTQLLSADGIPAEYIGGKRWLEAQAKNGFPIFFVSCPFESPASDSKKTGII